MSVAGPMNDTLSAYASLRWNDYEGPNNHWIRELDKNDLKHPNTVDTTTNPRHIRDTVSAMLELTWDNIKNVSFEEVKISAICFLYHILDTLNIPFLQSKYIQMCNTVRSTI